MIQVRESLDSDVEGIRELFKAEYGTDYCYPQYYDLQLLKKMVFSDNTIMLVAEDTDTHEIVGTASVVLDIGAYADLVGEFGRLVVHPGHRKKGIGNLLMQGRLERVSNRLQIGLVENRIIHGFSQKISCAQEFHFVGLSPQKLQMGKHRESIAVYVRHFGEALHLRNNHPRVIPEVFEIAEWALSNCKIQSDVILEDTAAAYPYSEELELCPLESQDYPKLLRLGRGRFGHREVFGPMRLHYGLFKLKERHSNYLLAKHNGSIVGGIGYSIDAIEKTAQVFELVSLNDNVIRFLIESLEKKCHTDPEVEYIEAHVSAYAPRMQRTFLESGFIPSAYIPAHVFHQVERLDSIRMARMLCPLQPHDVQGPDQVRRDAALILKRFEKHEIMPVISEALPRIGLFSGLNEEQQLEMAARFQFKELEQGESLFEEKKQARYLWILIEGEASIVRQSRVIGKVDPGECIGETAFLSRSQHSATARCDTNLKAAYLDFESVEKLIRSRPDIGVIVYRNLCKGLSDKLRRSS